VQKHVIVTDPIATPVTIPDNEPIVAMAGALLLQPVEQVLVSVTELPAQTIVGPEMTGGVPLTVTVVVT
jgi:hypothetical protein